MNPINAETAAAGELTRQCRMAAGPTQEELSENAELSVRARQRNALTSCPADTSRVLLGGRAGDLLGRRKMFITGLGVFTAASLAGGLATSQAWLIAARAAQGVGAAVVAPTALALITTTFPEGKPRNQAMGVYAAMSAAGGASA